MTVNFENESSTKTDLPLEALAGRVVAASLEAVRCPYEGEVSVLVTDPGVVRELNRTYRGIDQATDVLSFPMLPFEKPGDFSFLEKEDSDAFNPDTGELLLGDIVISFDRVLSQAKEYGHSETREYAFLIAHSMLHLTGFDHMEEGEREEMEQMQRLIMERLEIPRES